MFLTSTADGVTTLTLSRPPVNAISEEWVRAFEAKLDDLARGPRFTVLHIRSEQKVFCAGADLKQVQERMDAADGPDRMYSYVAGIQRLYARIESLPQVTIAEIGGAAMGGGFELALACDLRIAANEAKLGLPEVRLGLIPGAGGTQRLTRLCGPALASRLILGAEILDGAAAAELGVVHWAVPRAELAQRAAEMARPYRRSAGRGARRQQGLHRRRPTARARRLHRRIGIHPAAAQQCRDASARPGFPCGRGRSFKTDEKRDGMMTFDGKVALVTGGASGIGKATVMAFARQGATVICADVNAAAGEALKQEAAGAKLKVDFVAIDMGNSGSVRTAAAEVLARYPRVDILVNAAGWGDIQPYMQNTPEFIDRAIAINLTGPAHLTQALLPPMIAANGGKIVNIASDAGRVGSGGETVYAGAKGGLIAFTKSLAREVARYSINVNCVCPGPTDTPMLATRSEKLREAFLKAIPFRRFAKPEEIADAVLFFASPQSAYVTGQVMSVSGGLTFAG